MPNTAIPRYKRNAIFTMIMEGQSLSKIARDMEVHRRTVKKYRKEMQTIIKAETTRILSESVASD
jgi:DNA-binding CsgD family transcriptional regulator